MEEREAYFRETLRSLGPAEGASGSAGGALDEKASGSAGQALSQALEDASESKRTIRNLKAQLAARNNEIYEKGLKIDEMRLALMNSECKSEQLEKEAVEHRRQASNGPQRALNGPESGSFEKRLIETAFGPQDKEFELKMELEAAYADLTATNQQIGMMYERNEQEKDALKRQHAEVVADKDRVIEELNATIQLLQQW
ncbi:hypothetical protein CAEBREN_30010 [Caenorhabditis brenneri]|uniref:Uncharacterized protein n=1 Tax=Caenorhabditis brenneri TaxID=135651 RepID=G0PB68_CAEBE|nr:hypothetical protein CAEBREN_30010 [Caenorhabditis brenneri]